MLFLAQDFYNSSQYLIIEPGGIDCEIRKKYVSKGKEWFSRLSICERLLLIWYIEVYDMLGKV